MTPHFLYIFKNRSICTRAHLAFGTQLAKNTQLSLSGPNVKTHQMAWRSKEYMNFKKMLINFRKFGILAHNWLRTHNLSLTGKGTQSLNEK